jgi:hypothetical protein
MPVAPICFIICNGILLMPELLFALKACSIVLLSSAGVMCCVWVASSCVYYSGGIVGSKNSFWLWSVNSCRFRALTS